MIRLVSLLRGINVSGQKPVRMLDLKAMYESLGFRQVITYVQSGNVIFDSEEVDLALVAEILEKEIKLTFGFAVPVFLRTAKEIEQVVAANPFIQEENIDRERLYVTFLCGEPQDDLIHKLTPPAESQDQFQWLDREIYLYCPNGYGVTKLSNNFFEKKLKIPATTRNWKTVKALLELMKRD